MASPASGLAGMSPDDRQNSIRKSFRKSISRATRRVEEPPPPVPDLPPTLTLPLDIDPSSPISDSNGSLLSPGSGPPRRSKSSGTSSIAGPRMAAGLTAPAPSSNGASPAAALALSASASFAESDRKYAARQAVDEITNVRLSPHHANTLLSLCASEIKSRGLATPGIFRPMRLAESHREVDALIRLFLLSIDSERFSPLFDRNGGATAAQGYAATASTSATTGASPVGSGFGIGLPAGSCLNAAEEFSSLNGSLAPGQPPKQSDLLHLFDEKLDAATARRSLEERLQYASVLDVVALFKWGLRHLKVTPSDFGVTATGADAYSWYDQFKRDEAQAQYPLNAYKKYLLPYLQPQMAALLSTTFDLVSSVAAHHLSNFMPAGTIVRVIGFWLLGRIGSDHPPPSFKGIQASWSRACTITEHLLLAYIRAQIAESLYELPLRLTELVDGYPNLMQFTDSEAGAQEEFLSDAERISRNTPQLPLALRTRRVAAIKATLRSENIVVSLKRPRTPSDILSAVLSAEACDADENELVTWDIIQRAASRAAGGREREMSGPGGLVAAHRISMSQSRVNVAGPLTSGGYPDAGAESASSDPASAAAESLQRKRDQDLKREAAVLDEEHSRVFSLVAGAIAARRAVIEIIDPKEAAAATAALSGGVPAPQTRSMTSPTYGSVHNRYGGKNGSAFSRSTSEFGNMSPMSAGRASMSYASPGSPRQVQGQRRPTTAQAAVRQELRKSISFSGKPVSHTRESSLTPLPEDVSTNTSAAGTPSGAAPSLTPNGKAQNGFGFNGSSTLPASSSASASDWASFASSGFGANASNELTLTSPAPLFDPASSTDEAEELLSSPEARGGRLRRASNSYSSMRRGGRHALLNAAAINDDFGSPNGAGGDGMTASGSGLGISGAASVPAPTHRLLSLEMVDIDETLSATWQDQLLDFSVCAHFPPLVLASLNDSLVSTIHSALPDDALALSWILIDETVIPPRPPLPASDRSDSTSMTDKRSIFAPSIRSLATSIRKLRSLNFLSRRSREKSSADAMLDSGV
ncbi:hypothetical protein V8E36_003970 [Tilletia maclaganii]